MRFYRLSFDCDGASFVWSGYADNRAEAEMIAREDLAESYAGFSGNAARLVGSVVK